MTNYIRQQAMADWMEIVDELRRAPDWASHEHPIELKQTHISAVLIGKSHVLKLKKPVDFGFLDYTTLEKRFAACQAEVRLNRRLCPDIYLGVQPISLIDGRPRLSAEGSILDYGVWMRRLPDEGMLGEMVARGTVTESIIEAIAGRLSSFHQSAERGPSIDRHGSLEEIRFNWEENFRQTERFINRTITPDQFGFLKKWVGQWLASNEGLLRSRVAGGWIRDGHGDVRCESICVSDGEICIFDCIEFNERFRCGDVASEVAFLSMDLDARGRPDLGYYFCERYQAHSGDAHLFRMIPFYKCYRAWIRGKVQSFRLDEPEFSDQDKTEATRKAARDFDLACRYATPLRGPTMVVMSGLSGTGKTAVARAIAGELGLRVLSADAARQFLYAQEKRPSPYGEGAYTSEANARTYQTLIEMGGTFLRKDGGVILDATFRRRADRDLAREVAAAAGADCRIIECRLDPETTRQRLETRSKLRDGLSDADWEIYLKQREEFEPIEEADPRHHLRLETKDDIKSVARTAADWLRSTESRF